MGIVERRLREKEQRIREIIGAAKKLFLSKGYMNTTMLDIAEVAELSRRTIYSYFKSKEEISFKLIVDSFATILAGLEEVSGTEKTGMEQLVEMKDRYIHFFTHDYNQFYFTLLFDFKLSIENSSDPEAAECIRLIKEICSVFVSVLERGKSDGTIHVEGDLEITAFTMMTIIHSTMQKITGRREVLANVLEYGELDLIDNMFRLLFLSLK